MKWFKFFKKKYDLNTNTTEFIEQSSNGRYVVSEIGNMVIVNNDRDAKKFDKNLINDGKTSWLKHSLVEAYEIGLETARNANRLHINNIELVLKNLINSINYSGGVINANGRIVPCSDLDWFELGNIYMNACKILNIKPMIVKEVQNV